MIIRKVLIVTIAAVAVGVAGCTDKSKDSPAQNAAPVGEQKGPKARSVERPPPIEPIK